MIKTAKTITPGLQPFMVYLELKDADDSLEAGLNYRLSVTTPLTLHCFG